jgi:hypothetical protein
VGFCNVSLCGFCNVWVFLVICALYSEVFLNLTEIFLTLTEVFPYFSLSCKASSRVKPAKTRHDPRTLPSCCFVLYIFCVILPIFLCCSMYFCVVICIVCFLMFPILFVCICVLNNCHRVATQLQLNISHHICHDCINTEK